MKPSTTSKASKGQWCKSIKVSLLEIMFWSNDLIKTLSVYELWLQFNYEFKLFKFEVDFTAVNDPAIALIIALNESK